ncbi:hypothetical protein ACJJTC_005876 [Scirpophaga incertulas]
MRRHHSLLHGAMQSQLATDSSNSTTEQSHINSIATASPDIDSTSNKPIQVTNISETWQPSTRQGARAPPEGKCNELSTRSTNDTTAVEDKGLAVMQYRKKNVTKQKLNSFKLTNSHAVNGISCAVANVNIVFKKGIMLSGRGRGNNERAAAARRERATCRHEPRYATADARARPVRALRPSLQLLTVFYN